MTTRARVLAAVILAVLLVACEGRYNTGTSPGAGRASKNAPGAAGNPSSAATDAPVQPTDVVGEVAIYRDLVYSRIDGVRLALDIYHPGEGLNPGLMVIHGGGWRGGTKDGAGPTQSGITIARRGFTAVLIEYRLAPPGGRWHAPAPIIDARAALSWLRENGRSYGVDPDSIGAFGTSAGGHLSMLLAVTGTPGEDKVDAAASISGPTDLAADDEQVKAPGASEELRRDLVRNFMACTARECPELYQKMSPVANVDSSDAPIYQAVSETELVPIEQVDAMAEALDDAGVDNQLRVVPGGAHGRNIIRIAGPEALTFLGNRLGGARGTIVGPPLGPRPENALQDRIVISLAILVLGLLLVAVIAYWTGRRRRRVRPAKRHV